MTIEDGVITIGASAGAAVGLGGSLSGGVRLDLNEAAETMAEAGKTLAEVAETTKNLLNTIRNKL